MTVSKFGVRYPRYHTLGANIFAPEKVMFAERFWDVVLCTAQSRYGKTWAMKAVITQIGKVRNFIIFDFYGDWVGLSKYNENLMRNITILKDRNPYSFVDKVDDVTIIENPALTISDLSDPQDWLGLDMPEFGADVLADLATLKDTHHNDPEFFMEMLRNLPDTKKDIEDFNEVYKTDLKSPVSSQTKTSIVGRFRLLKSIFSQETSIEHWGEYMMKHKKIVVNFNAGESTKDRAKFRAVCGKILKQINSTNPQTQKKYLYHLHPVVVFEEADKLAPKVQGGLVGESDFPSTVVEQMREYCLKEQRQGILVLLITQEPGLIDDKLLLTWKTAICGKVKKPQDLRDERLTDSVRGLQSDLDKGLRQFVYMPEPMGRTFIFTPILPPCG